ncbi:MAG: outer membrane beta-barrel protein [Myxococcota bacterium]
MSASTASSAASKPARLRAAAARCAAALGVALVALLAAPLAQAQDWGDDSSEDWSSPQPAQPSPRTTSSSGASRSRNAAAGWSFQGGIGFTADPDTFLMNFEAPYAFNRWFSFGPAMQVGINDHRTIVAPTGNLRLTIPDLPGRAFDRVHPYAIAGMGFAVIDNDTNGRDNSAATGFLIDFGAGVEYQVSEKVFLGTQMIFNVLPDQVKGEHFYFAWQLGGIRFAF